MEQTVEMKVIARIHSDFPAKFGIPRQSGLVDTRAKIIFEKEYRNPYAVRGLEEYSYLWLLWEFSESKRAEWSPTVRPPRLGGNKRVGVFATRSPFRPNPIGLSSVKLDKIEISNAYGPVLHVTGADLMDGTPIFDIKPYLPYVDSHPQASGGFADQVRGYQLKVEFPAQWKEKVPLEDWEILEEILAQDPRPSYQNDPDRVYGMRYNNLEIKFSVEEDVITVREVVEAIG